MTTGPYARVYHAIVDDPKFERVYADDRALATWLRMLLIADAMYPTSAPMPAKTKPVQLLIEVGLIVEQPGNRYVVKGLAPEREKRSQSARNAAAVRWQSGSNASKAEQSRAETSSGANAPREGLSNGNAMGFRPRRPTEAEMVADVQRQEREAWEKCADCAKPRLQHPAIAGHAFVARQGAPA